MREEFFILRIAYLLNLYYGAGAGAVAGAVGASGSGNTMHRVGLLKISALLEQTCKQMEYYYYRYKLYPNLPCNSSKKEGIRAESVGTS